jgi:hypothetical protein
MSGKIRIDRDRHRPLDRHTNVVTSGPTCEASRKHPRDSVPDPSTMTSERSPSSLISRTACGPRRNATDQIRAPAHAASATKHPTCASGMMGIVKVTANVPTATMTMPAHAIRDGPIAM